VARTAKQQEAALAAARAAEHEAEVRRAQEEKAKEAERQRAADKAAKEKAEKALADKLEKEAAQKREDALAARLKAEISDKARAMALEKDARAAREKELSRQLAAEDHRQSAETAGLLGRYVGELQARVERAWIRPPTAVHGLHCVVHVSQVPGGVVTNVKIADCNADSAVQQSITLAVYRASPLPAPPDASLFERNLTLIFAPTD
jgi:colicin import membrane protein